MKRADVVTRDGDVYEACAVETHGVRTMGRKPRTIVWADIARIRYWRTTRGAWGVPPMQGRAA